MDDLISRAQIEHERDLVLDQAHKAMPCTGEDEELDHGARMYRAGIQDLARRLLALPAASQPEAEPVAWHTEDHLADRSATTWDKNVAERWKAKGWPVTPLYTHPTPAPAAQEAEPVAKGRFMDLPTKLRRAGEIVASGMVSDGQILWISDVVEDAALKIESRPTPAPVVPAEGMREVETKLKAMIAGFRHGLDPEGCSYDAGIRDVLDKLAAILAAAEKGAGNG